MPKQQLVMRQAPGLNLQFSPWVEPEGALSKADNCIIDREGVIEKRRGLKYFSDAQFSAPSSADYMDRLFEFKDRIHLFRSDTTSELYDIDALGSATAISSYTQGNPGADRNRIRFVEARQNLYFNNADGLYRRVDTANADPARAGMHPGMQFLVAATGAGGGWMLPDTKVRYRYCYRYEDSNGYQVRGAPSYPVELTNAKSSVTIDWSGGLAIVAQTAHGYSTSDTIIISGADESTYDGTYTITAIDADTYHFALPTVPTVKSDVAADAGKAIDASLTILPPTEDMIPIELGAGSTIKIVFEVYRTEMSASATTPPGDRCFKVLEREVTYTLGTPGSAQTITDNYDENFLGLELYTNTTQEGVLQANNYPPLAQDIAWFDGQLHLANFEGRQRLEVTLKKVGNMITTDELTITDGTDTLTIEAAATTTASTWALDQTSDTEAEKVENTAKAICYCINLNAASKPWIAHYISDTDDDPGKILIERRRVVYGNGRQFALTGVGFIAGFEENWEPEVPQVGTAVQSKADRYPNGLAYSKFEQPDHVPAGNWDPIGSEEDEIVRIVRLRDSLIIFKNEEGVWRKDRNGIVSELDPTVRLLAPESVAVLNNAVYCFTNHGVVRVTENGTAIVSRPIESELMEVTNYDTTGKDFRQLTHAVAYERGRKYILFTQSAITDSYPTQAWVYNYLNEGGTWTKWTVDCSAAAVNREEDLLYLYDPVDRYVRVERKTFTTLDYRDEDVATTLSNISTATDNFGNTVTTATSSAAAEEGDLLNQGAEYQRIIHVDGSTIYLDAENSNITAAAATISKGYACEIEWSEESAGNPALWKQFQEVTIYFETADVKFHQIGFGSDAYFLGANQLIGTKPIDASQEAQLRDDSQYATDVTPLRSWISTSYQRCRAIKVNYKNKYARDQIKITAMALTFRPIGEKTTGAPR